jgi:hypothetical protein
LAVLAPRWLHSPANCWIQGKNLALIHFLVALGDHTLENDDIERNNHMSNDVVRTSPDRVEAPVTAKAYMACAFAAFGGIFFGFDSGE